MILNCESIKGEKSKWKEAGIKLPGYDIEGVRKNTENNPQWLHFGAGNIFRGFIAGLADDLLEKGLMTSGVIAAETYDGQIIEKIYEPYDMLTLSVGLRASGDSIKSVTAGIGGALRLDQNDFTKVKDIAINPSLQMISFTITEKGYACKDMKGKILAGINNDIEEGPGNNVTVMGIVTSLLYERFKNGAYPIALVSMDNCSQNGKKLRDAVIFIAEKWNLRGLIEKDFIDYISDDHKVSFPWSMIDKITPRPDERIAEELKNLGVEGMDPIVTEKHTFIAPFVNAEIPQYLVIEDKFPNGRPPLEKAGVYMTDRTTVNNAEKMKVMTCLNPLHTALALAGCILGFKKISDEMQDPDLKKLVYQLGDEGMKVVVSPGIINPKDFIKEVLEERLTNPNLPDTPQRIATDTSQKLAIRFGETIIGYTEQGQEDNLRIIPFVIASWFRYLVGKDDMGNDMPLSPDPMLDMMNSVMKGIDIGKDNDGVVAIDWILTNIDLFGSNLMEIDGLADKIKNYLKEMLKEPGAYRRVLHELVSE
ncbi:MAG: mannitol dehydrogenase family protein [Eubacterium sp.]|nr:mannitol dehydrogenase family protein [Eubacterium sp.]